MLRDVNSLPVKLAHIALASYRLSPYLAPTPLEDAPALGENVALKLENLNKMRSFKVRGALNAMLALDAPTRQRGVVASSTGNHAQGVAYAAQLLNTRARIVMPITAAKRKIAGVHRCGGEVILHGAIYDDAEAEAHRIAHDEGVAYISPYADPDVVAGAGTVGLEILDAAPDVERIIVPIGGGGLISGIAVAVKTLRPSCEIIGVNPAVSPDMYNLFYFNKRPLPLSADTLADALPGAIDSESVTRHIVPALVDEIVLVTEDQIASAMLWLIHEHGLIGEGGGVVGIAALLHNLIPDDKRTVVVVTGGNVDPEVLNQVMSDE